MATNELPDAPWISSSKELPDAPWAQIGKPVAMTSGQDEAEKDQALIAKQAGITPDALKTGLYSAANTAGMNVPSHAVAAYESVSKNKPYWEAYKEQKEY